MSALLDLIVIGAGPAGAEAAATAAEQGLSVVVIDEGLAPGGQVYRQPTASAGTPPAPEGDALRERLHASNALVLERTVIWNVSSRLGDDGCPIHDVFTMGPDGPGERQARALIVASGATERFYARPGWTLPGVVGLGAATVMVKSLGILPGLRVVIAGAGPLLSLVAHLVIQGGGEVVAIADVNPLSDWIRLLPAMASRPDLLLKGLGWQLELLSRRVPVHRRFDVHAIQGSESVSGVVLRSLDGKPDISVEADAVCLGYGLIPSTDILRVLGAELTHVPALGGWVPRLDGGCRTTLSRVYAAGDGSGLKGAAAAPLQGRLAALTALRDLGRRDEAELAAELDRTRRRLDKAARFGSAMARLCMPSSGSMSNVADETIVCRCEDVSAGTIRAAASAGSRTLNSLKSSTRCGMGPCGGRSCSASADALMQCSGLSPQEIGVMTARPPLRPISLGALAGDFEYSDIPLPEPSPV